MNDVEQKLLRERYLRVARSCQVGSLIAHDGDGCRTNACRDSVACFGCGKAWPYFGPRMARIIASIILGRAPGRSDVPVELDGFELPTITRGHEATAEAQADARFAASLSELAVADISGLVRMSFRQGSPALDRTIDDAHVELEYDEAHVDHVERPGYQIGELLSDEQKALLPSKIRLTVEALEVLGCRAQAFSVDGSRLMNSVTVRYGQPVENTPCVLGVSVQLSWTVRI